MISVTDEHPSTYVKYHGGIEKLIALTQPQRMWKPYVVWLYGPTGVGKTRWAHEYWAGELGKSTWTSNGKLEYFLGYNNETVAILDDYRGCYAPFHQLLLVLDRYPMRANVKHGHVTWNPKVIIVTSSKSPRDVYNVSETETDQLVRRIDVIINVIHYSLEPHVDGRLGDSSIWDKGISWENMQESIAKIDW